MANKYVKIRRPFLWSVLFSGFSLVFIEIGILFFREGLRGPGAVASLFGLVLLLVEIVIFLPALFKNVLRDSKFSFLFKITLAGYMYIALIVFIALAAINTGNNLLYILLAFMISAIVISGIVSRISLNNLKLSVDYQDSIFVGEFTTYRLSVSNRKRWLPSFSIGIEGFLINQTWLAARHPQWRTENVPAPKTLIRSGVPLMRTVAYFPYLSAGGDDSQVFQVQFHDRGLYSINRIEVSTSFPFGFFRKGRRISTSGQLIVFPSPADVNELDEVMEKQAETLPVLRRGRGPEIYTLREYVEGEDVRHIHWKASARVGRYIIKEYALEIMPGFLFLVDESVPDDPSEKADQYERVISFLATMFMELYSQGKAARVVFSHSETIEDRRGVSLMATLEHLSLSYLRTHSAGRHTHPFNVDVGITSILAEWQGTVTLCSFREAEYFHGVAPYVENYLDLNNI